MLPDSITALIAALSKLPGVGPRSAEAHRAASRANGVRRVKHWLSAARPGQLAQRGDERGDGVGKHGGEMVNEEL